MVTSKMLKAMGMESFILSCWWFACMKEFAGRDALVMENFRWRGFAAGLQARF